MTAANGFFVYPECLNCGCARRIQGRGLCSPCYRKIDVRLQYPLLQEHLFEQQHGGDNPGNGAPCLPTPARPGTPEKVFVLAERVALKQHLWHDLDAPACGG